jgi:hypothetical protein
LGKGKREGKEEKRGKGKRGEREGGGKRRKKVIPASAKA